MFAALVHGATACFLPDGLPVSCATRLHTMAVIQSQSCMHCSALTPWQIAHRSGAHSIGHCLDCVSAPVCTTASESALSHGWQLATGVVQAGDLTGMVPCCTVPPLALLPMAAAEQQHPNGTPLHVEPPSTT